MEPQRTTYHGPRTSPTTSFHNQLITTAMSRIHRRHFLQNSALLTGAALAARPLFARSRPGHSANEQLNVGFIGLGGRCKELLPQFDKLKDARIAAICDVDEDRVAEWAKSHKNAKKYT